MTATFIKVKAAQPMGKYFPTVIDAQKSNVDFRITACDSKNTIVWNDGRFERVTDAKLNRLQTLHTWTTDF